ACHYYFLIYSGAIWAAVAAEDLLPWKISIMKSPSNPPLQKGGSGGIFLGLAILSGALAAWIIFRHPADIILGKTRIGLESPANAVLVMWVGVFGWIASHYKLKIDPRPLKLGPRNHVILALSALFCLSPLIIATLKLVLAGGYPTQHILWKTPP